MWRVWRTKLRPWQRHRVGFLSLSPSPFFFAFPFVTIHSPTTRSRIHQPTTSHQHHVVQHQPGTREHAAASQSVTTTAASSSCSSSSSSASRSNRLERNPPSTRISCACRHPSSSPPRPHRKWKCNAEMYPLHSHFMATLDCSSIAESLEPRSRGGAARRVCFGRLVPRHPACLPSHTKSHLRSSLVLLCLHLSSVLPSAKVGGMRLPQPYRAPKEETDDSVTPRTNVEQGQSKGPQGNAAAREQAQEG